jgi:stress-induced morphogen
MADEGLKLKVRDALRATTFGGKEEAVDVSDGEVDPHIHVVVFSRKFDGLGFGEKHDLIWNALEASLTPDELVQITLVVGVTPQDAKAYI